MHPMLPQRARAGVQRLDMPWDGFDLGSMLLRVGDFLGTHRSATWIVDSRRGYSYPLHRHEGFGEFLYLARGSLRHRVNGIEMTLEPGDLVLVREQDEHAVACDDALYFNTNIHSDDLERVADYLYDGAQFRAILLAAMPPMARIPTGQRPGLEDLFVRLQVHQGTDLGARLLQQILIQCCQAVLPLPASVDGPQPPPWLGQLQVEAVTALPTMTPAALARLAGVSPEHLARCFQRHLGTTPTAWLNRQRLDRAVVALVKTGNAVTDIALDLGFGSPGYFARVFRTAYGCTPLAYRQRHPRA